MTTKYCWSCYSSHKQTKTTFSGQIMETGRVLLLMKTQMQDLWASQMALEVKNKKTKQNKKPSANAGEGKRCRFDPWFGDIPWRRAQQPPPVFLPGESHGQRSLAGYSPWGHGESDMTEATYCACRDVLKKDCLRYVFIQIPNTEHGTISFSEWPGNLSSAARKS